MAAPRIGTGFTNLQNVLQANQGNQLGSAVGQGIANVAQGATSGLQQSEDQFNTQTQQQEAANTTQQNAAGNLIQEAATNPTALGSQDYTNYLNSQQASYGGPAGLGNAQQLQSQGQQAGELGQLAGTSAGRGELLSEFAAKPGTNYSVGARDIDTALLGQTGGGQLQAARQQTVGLPQKINAGVQSAQNQAQAGATALANLQAGNKAALGDQTTGAIGANNAAINTAVQNQATQIGGYQTNLANFKSHITSGQGGLGLNDLLSAGYSQPQAQSIMQAVGDAAGDPGALAAIANNLQTIAPAGGATAQTAATAQQQASANALAQLGGATTPVFTNITGPSQVAGGITSGGVGAISGALTPTDIAKAQGFDPTALSNQMAELGLGPNPTVQQVQDAINTIPEGSPWRGAVPGLQQYIQEQNTITAQQQALQQMLGQIPT